MERRWREVEEGLSSSTSTKDLDLFPGVKFLEMEKIYNIYNINIKERGFREAKGEREGKG